MNAKTILCLAAIVNVLFANSSSKYVVPFADNTAIFSNETRQLYEKPISKVGPQDYLQVLKENERSLLVSDSKGNTGWIERRLVHVASIRARLSFGDASVEAYLNAVQPIYLIDMTNPEDIPLKLDRSFRSSLSVNVDKEEIARMVE